MTCCCTARSTRSRRRKNRCAGRMTDECPRPERGAQPPSIEKRWRMAERRLRSGRAETGGSHELLPLLLRQRAHGGVQLRDRGLERLLVFARQPVRGHFEEDVVSLPAGAGPVRVEPDAFWVEADARALLDGAEGPARRRLPAQERGGPLA